MHRKIHLAAWAAAAVVSSSLSAGAAVVGFEGFDYPDGTVVDQAGGTGWAYERTQETGAVDSVPSDWDLAGGTANVVGGTLVTTGGGARRQFNGPVEGSAAGSNEREGAFRGTGSVFFGADMTRQAGADWSGVSSFDFANERLFFGVPSGQAFFGISENGVGRTLSTTLQPAAGQTYRIVAEVNFDADVVRMWVNPDAGDQATPDLTRPYTATNWSTAVRLASGGTGSTTWDNLVVATDWNDPGLVPEPGSLALLGLGGLGLLRRRR